MFSFAENIKTSLSMKYVSRVNPGRNEGTQDRFSFFLSKYEVKLSVYLKYKYDFCISSLSFISILLFESGALIITDWLFEKY